MGQLPYQILEGLIGETSQGTAACAVIHLQSSESENLGAARVGCGTMRAAANGDRAGWQLLHIIMQQGQ